MEQKEVPVSVWSYSLALQDDMLAVRIGYFSELEDISICHEVISHCHLLLLHRQDLLGESFPHQAIRQTIFDQHFETLQRHY
jgi:hypothetical protein